MFGCRRSSASKDSVPEACTGTGGCALRERRSAYTTDTSGRAAGSGCRHDCTNATSGRAQRPVTRETSCFDRISAASSSVLEPASQGGGGVPVICQHHSPMFEPCATPHTQQAAPYQLNQQLCKHGIVSPRQCCFPNQHASTTTPANVPHQRTTRPKVDPAWRFGATTSALVQARARDPLPPRVLATAPHSPHPHAACCMCPCRSPPRGVGQHMSCRPPASHTAPRQHSPT